MYNYKKGSKRLGIVVLLAYWIVICVWFIYDVTNAPDSKRYEVSHSGHYSYQSSETKKSHLFISYELGSGPYGQAALEGLDEKYRNCLAKPDKSTSTEDSILTKERICSIFSSKEYSLSKEINFIAVLFFILIVPILCLLSLFAAIYTVKLFSKVVAWVHDGFKS